MRPSHLPTRPIWPTRPNRLHRWLLNVRDNYWPKAVGPDPALHVQGYVNSICTSIMMVLAVVILISAARQWLVVLSGKGAALEPAQA